MLYHLKEAVVELALFQVRTRPDIDRQAYEAEFGRMLECVALLPGFVSIEGFAGEDGSELAVARFDSAESIAAWRDHPDHVAARRRGREEFFDSYDITIASVSRRYDWARVASIASDVDDPGATALA